MKVTKKVVGFQCRVELTADDGRKSYLAAIAESPEEARREADDYADRVIRHCVEPDYRNLMVGDQLVFKGEPSDFWMVMRVDFRKGTVDVVRNEERRNGVDPAKLEFQFAHPPS